jgi:sugar-specific transcriptional regulator TrmB
MSEDESVTNLRAFGLNLYESRAYLALIKGRNLTAKGVGQLGVIPQSRTYDVLESLSRKGFAMATPGSPTTYVPVSPTKVLGSKYAAEKKRIQDDAFKVQEGAQGKLESLRDAYASLTNSLSGKVDERSVVRDRVWVLQSRENIESTLIEFIKESRSTIFRITKPPELKSAEKLDPFYIVGMENRRYIYDALERKVKMRWLSLTREIPTFSGLEVGEPPERRYIENERDITEKFLLVDNHSVMLNLHDPVSSAYGSVALAMQSRAAASIFMDHFERLWKKGKPLDEIMPKMKRLVRDVGKRLGEIGFSRPQVLFYETLAKLGTASRESVVAELVRKKVQRQDSEASCDALIRLGLVHKDSTYRLLMVEYPAVVQAAIDSGRLVPQGGKVTTRESGSSRNP